MINFLSGILASLVANVISTIYGVERNTHAKKAFTKRAEIFHKKITPYLLDRLLPEQLLDVANKLAIEEVDGTATVLPYIALTGDSNIKLARSIVTENRSIKHDKKLLHWMTSELGKTIDNNPTFTLQGISSSGELIIGTSDYMSTLSTSDVNYFDLIRYFPVKSKFGLFFAYRNNKRTKKWLNSLRKIVIDRSFTHYHASIGCSVLTVMKTSDGKYKYPIKQNSSEKGSSAMERHVLPSFMLQPISRRIKEQERELDLSINVLREYGEELLGIPELEQAETVDVMLNHIYSHHLLKKMKRQLDKGKATLEVTGLVLDIFRLRPEITFLLVLHDDCYAKNLKTNWEAESHSLDLIELNDSLAYSELLSSRNCPLCSPGMAALINGRKRALEHLKGNGKL